MPKPFDHWTVLPHGPVATVADNIRTVVGTIHMPLMDLPRRMTIVRTAGRRLIVYSAIALDDEEMATLESFGTFAYLVVPSDKHRLDARIWKDRYPTLTVVAPRGAREKVEQVVPVDTTEPRFDDPNVEFTEVGGTREREAALVVRTPTGTTLVLNDVIGNIHDGKGVGGWLLHVAGFAGETAQIPRVVKSTVVDDEKALRAQLLEWAAIESLERILVSHGAPIEGNVRQILRDVADTLH